VSASSASPDHRPEGVLGVSAPGDAGGGWRSVASAEPQWLSIDFGVEREYGGLRIDWAPGCTPGKLELQVSGDASNWQTACAATDVDGPRSYLYMPATRARYLRLLMQGGSPGRGYGIEHIEIKPFEFSRSIQAFFHGMASEAPRGSYPKYLSSEQTYWSPAGVHDGETCAVLNEEGMVEVDKGSFSIEPFVSIDGRLLTWADAQLTQTLEDGYLPIPSSRWAALELALCTTAFATRVASQPVLFIRYRAVNHARRSRSLRLYAACRPFQVTPPWQAHQQLGGLRKVREIEASGNTVRVDRDTLVISLGAPAGFGAAAFAEGALVDLLRSARLPRRTRVHDDFGYASGVLAYDLELAPGASGEVYLAVPFTKDRAAQETLARTFAGASAAQGAAEFERAITDWRTKLGGVELRLPGEARPYVDTFLSAVAHVLVNRDGPALQPGPRRYTRSWIRDGATMAAALLRVGCPEEAVEFIRWYAPFQSPEGAVPCCVDRNGVDWLVEHDSHGELIFTVMECYRFTHDRAFLKALWPAVIKAVDHIEALRATRLGPDYQSGERRARYGLLPESASHEGYLAHPVHAYWDDFWALRGLRDACGIAEALGEDAQASRIAVLRDALRTTLYASIDLTMSERKIDFIPGSVEWADFDPTATANPVGLLDELANLPRAALDRTFDAYLERFRRRVRNEIEWVNYTAYEVRIIAALVQLGRRDDAVELADFLIGDRRPLAWNQWPEITWPDPKTPGHLGDLPHSWIGAEYVLAFRTMLVFERESERVLVIGAGVPARWLAGDGIVARRLPTYYGALDLSMRLDPSGVLHVSVGGELGSSLSAIILRPPLAGPLSQVEIDGAAVQRFERDQVTLTRWPAEVRMRCP
jgi:hypothetical protein